MKRLPVTDQVKQIMKTNLGDVPADADIALFETVALDGQPFKKGGSVWEGSVATASFMAEMVAWVRPNQTVPFNVMHDDRVLPVGRVFHAEMHDGAVRALFYTTNMKLAGDIDNSVVDSVSIGAMPRHMNCSACGWDYRGEDATVMHLIDRTCANEHQIGKDGVHLKLNGVESWLELSAVGNGANPGAKILSRTKAALTQEVRTRLAASHTPTGPIEPYLLFASGGVKGMDPKEFIAKLEANATEIAELKVKLTAGETAKTDATALQAKVTTLEAQVTDLTAKVTGLDAAKVFLKEQAKRALVATSKPADNIPEDVAALVQILSAAQMNLANLLPVEGRSQAGDSGKDKPAGAAPASAFSVRKLA